MREGYEKNVISATAAIVFRFTRRRCYHALSLALAGLSCFENEKLKFEIRIQKNAA